MAVSAAGLGVLVGGTGYLLQYGISTEYCMKKSTKAALLSALICPGAGHIFLKKYIRAMLLVAATLAGVGYSPYR